MGPLRRALRGRGAVDVARSPIAWVFLVLLALRVVAITWGLPASDAWDNDGVAPRDFLAGLVETFTPGHFYTYPPVHLALLAAMTLPVTIVALARAKSLSRPDVVHEILKVPYMTTMAFEARLVSLAMSLAVVWSLAKMAEQLRGKRAGWCAAAFAGMNVPFTYYSHTTNLDVPYLFWGCLAVLEMMRAVERREPGRLRRWALLAALSVGTKDQAYALFLVAAPLTVFLWMALDPWGRAHWRAIARDGAMATLAGVGVLVLVDGAVFNPTGFCARARFLLGPASQDYAAYTNDWLGRWDVVRDLGSHLGLDYPAVFAFLPAIGLAIVVVERSRRAHLLVAALLPLFTALSFTFAFNCVARRTDPRFGLPQTLLAAVYGGVALDALLFRLRGPFGRSTARMCAAAAFAVALFDAADVDANLVLDPRYEAEAWLRRNAAPSDVIETYGLNVYMPRFPSGTRVIRVGPQPSDHRNPMPGVDEVFDSYARASARGAKYIVVSDGWAWRYLLDPKDFPVRGRVLPPTQRATGSDRAATRYFKALTAGQYRHYRLAFEARWRSDLWPPIELHASTARSIWIYERQPGG